MQLKDVLWDCEKLWEDACSLFSCAFADSWEFTHLKSNIALAFVIPRFSNFSWEFPLCSFSHSSRSFYWRPRALMLLVTTQELKQTLLQVWHTDVSAQLGWKKIKALKGSWASFFCYFRYELLHIIQSTLTIQNTQQNSHISAIKQHRIGQT